MRKRKRKDNDILTGFRKITEIQDARMAKMIEAVVGANRGTTKLVKPAEVPGWTKAMKLEIYLKALEVWMETNKDIGEGIKYQDVIESLKNNKEIVGLQQYVAEHIMTKLDMVEKQKVKQITELLKLRYGRTRIEELEVLMEDRIKFDANEHDNEDEYLFAMEKLIARKEELKVTHKEWDSIWMMVQTRKRKGVESYQLQELRKVVKETRNKILR